VTASQPLLEGPTAERELVVVSGPGQGTVYPLRGRVTLGSTPESSIQVPGPLVAPVHASIETLGGSLRLRSVSGWSVFLNGSQVMEAAVPENSIIRIGDVTFKVQTSTDGLEKTANRPSGPIPLAAVVTNEPGLAIGEEIEGRYRVVAKLGEGGMGEVYKVEHIALQKPMAMKVLRQSLSGDPGFVKRFEREAVTASRIGQENIVEITDFSRLPDGRFYFVMEYLDGQTLAQLVRAEGALPVARVLSIVRQICQALAAAHAQQILHRDIKPDNVMVFDRSAQPDFVKVLDFGIAKVNETGEGVLKTGVGEIVGTPQYLSPEQATGQAQDARSDIYSLGVLMYELLRGEPPFTGQTPTHVIAAHITQPAPLLPSSTTTGPLPSLLRTLVGRMLAKSKDDRPSSIADVLSQMDAIDLVQGQLDAAKAAIRRPRWGLAAGGVLGAALLGALVYTVAKPSPGKPEAVVPQPFAVSVEAAQPLAVLPPAPPAPAVSPVVVQMDSTPTGAEVFQGSQRLGRTPMQLHWSEGQRGDLRFQLAGYWTEDRTVIARQGETVSIVLRKAIARHKDNSESNPYNELEDLKHAPY
jgi:hypothetical protein